MADKKGHNTQALQKLTIAIEANTAALEKGLKKAEDSVKKFSIDTNKLAATAFTGLGAGVSKTTKAISKLTKGLKTANKGVSYFGRVLKRVMLYRAVRQVIASITNGLKEGVSNLEAYSEKMGTTFKPNLESIKESLLFVKNATAAMVAPIVNFLTPAVNALAEAFANMANQIGFFIAKLTGQTSFSAAIRGAKELNSEAGKLKKTLFGFDELNIFNAPGGSSSEETGGYFEEWETAPNKFADLIKAQNWEGVGAEIAKKLNEALSNLNVKEAGEKIKAWLKKALDIGIGFVKTFNFEQVGNKALEFADAVFDPETAWEFGEFAGKLLTGVADAVLGLFTGPDAAEKWRNIGESIRSAIVGAVTAINEWFDSKDWDGLYQSIEDSATAFFNDGLEMKRTALAVLNVIVRSLTTLFKISKAAFGPAMVELFTTMNDATDDESQKETHAVKLAAIFKVLFTAGIGGGVTAFLTGDISKGIAAGLATGFVTLVVESVKTAQNVDAIISAIAWLFGSIGGAKLGAAIGSAIGGPAGTLIGGLIGGMIGGAVVGGTTYKVLDSGMNDSTLDVDDPNASYYIDQIKKKKTSVGAGARAGGGFVDTGEMFIAREAGPELVGTIGNRTAVANNDQIVEGIANGVASAMDNTNSVIMQMANAVVNAIANKEINTQVISDRDIYRASERGRTLAGRTVIS